MSFNARTEEALDQNVIKTLHKLNKAGLLSTRECIDPLSFLPYLAFEYKSRVNAIEFSGIIRYDPNRQIDLDTEEND